MKLPALMKQNTLDHSLCRCSDTPAANIGIVCIENILADHAVMPVAENGDGLVVGECEFRYIRVVENAADRISQPVNRTLQNLGQMIPPAFIGQLLVVFAPLVKQALALSLDVVLARLKLAHKKAAVSIGGSFLCLPLLSFFIHKLQSAAGPIHKPSCKVAGVFLPISSLCNFRIIKVCKRLVNQLAVDQPLVIGKLAFIHAAFKQCRIIFHGRFCLSASRSHGTHPHISARAASSSHRAPQPYSNGASCCPASLSLQTVSWGARRRSPVFQTCLLLSKLSSLHFKMGQGNKHIFHFPTILTHASKMKMRKNENLNTD